MFYCFDSGNEPRIHQNNSYAQRHFVVFDYFGLKLDERRYLKHKFTDLWNPFHCVDMFIGFVCGLDFTFYHYKCTGSFVAYTLFFLFFVFCVKFWFLNASWPKEKTCIFATSPSQKNPKDYVIVPWHFITKCNGKQIIVFISRQFCVFCSFPMVKMLLFFVDRNTLDQRKNGL